jgi:hypothetical protein
MQYNPQCTVPTCFLTLEDGKEELRSLGDIQVKRWGNGDEVMGKRWGSDWEVMGNGWGSEMIKK